MIRARVIAVAIALFLLSHPIIGLLCALGSCATQAQAGTQINAASGLVVSVTPGSSASAAGLRTGDRVDFARAGPTMHLWLWDAAFPVGRTVALPILRNGLPLTVGVVAARPPLNAGTVTYCVVALLFALLLAALGCAAIFARVDSVTIAFYVFSMYYVTTNNTAWLLVSPPPLTPIAALESVLPVLASTMGFLYLCLRFPTGRPVGGWRIVDRCVAPFGLVLGLAYYLHFYQSAFITGTTGSLYVVTAVLSVASGIVGFVAYVARFWSARGPELTRMRWVAAAIAIYIASLVLFFIDQVVNRTPTPWINWLFDFNPAPFAFAYALIVGRVVDIRIAGGRAVIYAAITTIPIALLAFADWFFGRRLEDARLATVFEIGIALAFSFWLQSIHRRINHFAERVFFAARNRAFQRMHHLTRALPFTEKVSTIESLLAEETAQTMRFTSGALFREQDGEYVRTASLHWDGAAQSLDPDDPIVLFARSERQGVQLGMVAESKAALPAGEAKPAFALPIVVGRRTIAVVLYGAHRDGEVIDASEEQLLGALAHAAATAYEHLHAEDRERENAQLRAQLAQLLAIRS